MNLEKLPSQVEHFIRHNSTAILAGIGATGVVTTGYLSWKVGYRVGFDEGINDESSLISEAPFKVRFKRGFDLHWKHHIPPVLVGGVAIGCIIAGTRVGNRRTAAMAAAYSISERAFTEYKDKVVEKLGERKDQSVRDDIAQDKVTKAAISRDTVLYGSGTVLCYELHTGRPFLSDMETLKKAQNEVNARLLKHDYAYLSDFYQLIGLGHTSSADNFGWMSDRQMELEFSTTLADESRPCLAFEYNYLKML